MFEPVFEGLMDCEESVKTGLVFKTGPVSAGTFYTIFFLLIDIDGNNLNIALSPCYFFCDMLFFEQ